MKKGEESSITQQKAKEGYKKITLKMEVTNRKSRG